MNLTGHRETKPRIKSDTSQQVLTENDAASILQVTPFALRKWRRYGFGPSFIRCGARLIRYARKDLDAWLEQNKFASDAHELSTKTAKTPK